MFKVNNRNARTRCEICSKLTIKTPERSQCRRSVVFIVNFEHFTTCSSVSIVNFEQVFAGWVCLNISILELKFRRVNLFTTCLIVPHHLGLQDHPKKAKTLLTRFTQDILN